MADACIKTDAGADEKSPLLAAKKRRSNVDLLFLPFQRSFQRLQRIGGNSGTARKIVAASRWNITEFYIRQAGDSIDRLIRRTVSADRQKDIVGIPYPFRGQPCCRLPCASAILCRIYTKFRPAPLKLALNYRPQLLAAPRLRFFIYYNMMMLGSKASL